jgi:hypothetical protein
MGCTALSRFGMAKTVTAARVTERATVALLCLGDSSVHPDIALTPVFGWPFIHHLIKSLEAHGIKKFFIGTETVPGSLLSYCDQAKAEGSDVQLVRNPREVVDQIDDKTLVLVQSADIVWDKALLEKAMAEHRPLISAVEERSENQGFERIDLNHRWGGLTMLERRSFDALEDLPEGWDMASSLLRRALQDALPLWAVRQAELQAGAVQKIERHANLAVLAKKLVPSVSGPTSLENALLMPLAERLLPFSWATSWARPLTEWAFPATGAIVTALAYFELPLAAVVLAIFSICLALLRQRVRHAEYRRAQGDWFGRAGWAMLSLSLGLALHQGLETAAESIFLTISICAISLLARRVMTSHRFWLTSPLAIGATALWGQVAGLTGWSIRILIVAQLALLLWPNRKNE